MKSGYISLTTRCGHRCLCCPCRREAKAKGEDLPMEEVLRSADQGLVNGLSEMVLSGGEPTLHADLRGAASRSGC